MASPMSLIYRENDNFAVCEGRRNSLAGCAAVKEKGQKQTIKPIANFAGGQISTWSQIVLVTLVYKLNIFVT
jgi:hypothetical protein